MLAAAESGFITRIHTRAVGEMANLLGAGRRVPGASLDPAAGIVVHKKTGEAVVRGEPLCTLHYNRCPGLDEFRAQLQQAFEIGPQPVDAPPLIKQIVEFH